MSIIAKFYPNGEFSQGVDTSKKRRHEKRRHEDCRDKNWKERRDEYYQWSQEFSKVWKEPNQVPIGTELRSRAGLAYRLEEATSNSCSLSWEDCSGARHTTTVLQSFPKVAFDWGLIPIGLSNGRILRIFPSRKKLDKMTTNMARNIRNGVYLLEQLPGGKDCLSFLTLTLPALSPEGLSACCQKWDYMIKRFLDWLRTRMEKYNMPLQHVYCTEVQGKRLEKRHEFAPHLHIVFRGRNGKKCAWVVTPKQIRKAWARCISSVVAEQFSTSALENIQRIKYSAARYLSKYLGKGSRSLPQAAKEYYDSALHTQWGGMSRDISRLIKQNTRRLTDVGKYAPYTTSFVNRMAELHAAGLIAYYTVRVINTCEAGVETFGFGLIVRSGALSTPVLDGGLIDVLEYFERVPGLDRD